MAKASNTDTGATPEEVTADPTPETEAVSGETPETAPETPEAPETEPAAATESTDPTEPGGPLGTKEQNDEAKAEVKERRHGHRDDEDSQQVLSAAQGGSGPSNVLRHDSDGSAPSASTPDAIAALGVQERTHINAVRTVGTIEDPNGVERIVDVNLDSGWTPAPVSASDEQREAIARRQAALDAKKQERLDLMQVK